MIPVINAAAAGMATAARRLEASARSIAAPLHSSGDARVYLLMPADRLAAVSPVRPAHAGFVRPVVVSAPAWLAEQAPAVGTDLKTGPQPRADVAEAMLEQASAEHSFKASAQAFSVGQDMVRRLFDLLD
jgi:hypothetical protein